MNEVFGITQERWIGFRRNLDGRLSREMTVVVPGGECRGKADRGGKWRGVETLGQSEIKGPGRGRCDPFN